MYGKPEHYGYLFHYNPHNNTWNGFPRDKYREYFNGEYKKENGLISNEDPFFVLSACASQARQASKQITN